jgi:hypothetical protein
LVEDTTLDASKYRNDCVEKENAAVVVPDKVDASVEMGFENEILC